MTSPIGAYLRAKRCAAKLSLRDVADRIGMTHVVLSEIERGLRPVKPERLAELAAMIGFDPAELERVAAGELPAPEPVHEDLGATIVRRLEQRRDIKLKEMLVLHRLLLGSDE